ncbi:MAG: hypothetical protein QXS12_03635, partial [Candidatus Caldarchaeum sp.]
GQSVPDSMRRLAESMQDGARTSSTAVMELSNALRTAENAVKDLSTAGKTLAASLDYYNVLTRLKP